MASLTCQTEFYVFRFQILGFSAFSLSSFMYYTISPFVLKLSGATMFNLSLLTSDMWAVVIPIFFYRQKPKGSHSCTSSGKWEQQCQPCDKFTGHRCMINRTPLILSNCQYVKPRNVLRRTSSFGNINKKSD
ncbi:hypothetical protein LWI28_014314 [Acer negundo]|uniref:Uncharacterized protein n=1 Tax=Acer negundo TaxID=4023 RepID=A0AAD5I6S4_ACENE|nr:hypothetical protein LWI28_014314 [Acer negundo]